MSNNQGWVKLYRKILDWEWWDDKNTSRLFITVILNANHEDVKWQGLTIKKGQWATSLTTIKRQSKLTIRAIRTSLNKLKMTNELTIETTNRYTILTVCNYSTYQQPSQKNDKENDKQNDNQTTNKRQTEDEKNDNKQEVTNTKNDKNEKNKKRALPFIPPSIEQVEKYCQVSGYQVNASEFVRYYSAADPPWHDQSGKPVKSWKQKIIAVWSKNFGQTPVLSNEPPPVVRSADGLTTRERLLLKKQEVKYDKMVEA